MAVLAAFVRSTFSNGHPILRGHGALLAVTLASLVPVLVAGQEPTASTVTPAATADGLTPWGEPDLQGIWTVTYKTPLERPAEFAGREFLSDEEMAELDQTRVANLGGNARTAGQNRAGRGTEQDVANAYNNVFNSYKRTGRRTSLVVDPPDGRIPPRTESVQRLLQAEQSYRQEPWNVPDPGTYNTGRLNRADGPEDRATGERCLGSSLPDFGTGEFGEGNFRIVQSPGYVTIYHEHGGGGGANRVIPVDDSDHLPPHIELWVGDSRARWEGQTLVVDTTNFSSKTSFMGSREHLHLVERFTRVDGSTLIREIRVEDPTVWTRDWTVRVELTQGDDRANLIFESTCHEGNFGMTGILASTRAAEKAFAEGRGPDPTTTDIATGNSAGSGGTVIDVR